MTEFSREIACWTAYKHKAKIMRVIMKAGVPSRDREDVFMVAMERAMVGIEGSRPRSVIAWLVTIARNVAIDYKRREQEIPSNDLVASLLGHYEIEEGSSSTVMPGLVEIALNDSYQAAADAFGIPLGTVKSRVNRWREAMKEKWNPDGQLND